MNDVLLVCASPVIILPTVTLLTLSFTFLDLRIENSAESTVKQKSPGSAPGLAAAEVFTVVSSICDRKRERPLGLGTSATYRRETSVLQNQMAGLRVFPPSAVLTLIMMISGVGHA